jgi:hypothetical protein|tara:strand:- start:668 stop:928 length:261 start_codon:yes stop_codon:yes gene_type:complete
MSPGSIIPAHRQNGKLVSVIITTIDINDEHAGEVSHKEIPTPTIRSVIISPSSSSARMNLGKIAMKIIRIKNILERVLFENIVDRE